MILSDRSIREALAAGRIVIDPLGEGCVQPSSVDLHVDRFFRVFRNHTMGFIDVKENLEDLTELVEVADGDRFILHPGEFVLGSTHERVALPDDLVARLEGKSSLGRLGLLIHSSLPASETVLIRHHGRLEMAPIGDVVRKSLRAEVAGFDPTTLRMDFHAITGWYEGPPDRIFEVRLATGRTVHVTAGHNLFTLDRAGQVVKTRTCQLRPGARVAIPRQVPDPADATASPGTSVAPAIEVGRLVPEALYDEVTVNGPTVARAFERHRDVLLAAFAERGSHHLSYYASCSRLPMVMARQVPGLLEALTPQDRVGWKGGRNSIPAVIGVTSELAWLLGLYVAEGYRRRQQAVWSNTDQAILDRAESALLDLDLPVHRSQGAITCCSAALSHLLHWLGTGGKAAHKRVPPAVLSWPRPLIEAFLAGMVDGDGSVDGTRTSVWTCSEQLVGDLLTLAQRLGRRASCSWRTRGSSRLAQVQFPHAEHKTLTAVPLPDLLLQQVRAQTGLSQVAAARAAGYTGASDLNNIERRSGRDAVRWSTLRRLRDAYRTGACGAPSFETLDRLVEGDLLFDVVEEVVDTGSVEPIFDLEVRPGGARIENFVAGSGGVLVSNTAGFVDAGWDGHLTLELSNVANLPITLYPGMKIGQISFLQMTTPADQPYGSGTLGSKYRGQRGPTPSRYFENFRT